MPPCCRLVQPKLHRLMWATVIGPEDVRAAIAVEIGDEKVVRAALGHDHFSPTVALPAVEIHAHLLWRGTLVHASSHDIRLSVAIHIGHGQTVHHGLDGRVDDVLPPVRLGCPAWRFAPGEPITLPLVFGRCEDHIHEPVAVNVTQRDLGVRPSPVRGEHVLRPRALHTAIVLKPPAADDDIGIAIAVQIAHSQSLAVRTIHRVIAPPVRPFLAPEMDPVPSVVAEPGLVACDEVQPPIAVKVKQRHIVGANVTDAMKPPGILRRVTLGSRILEPHLRARDEVRVTISVHVTHSAADRAPTAFGHRAFPPARVCIPDERPGLPTDGDVQLAIAVEVAGQFHPRIAG